MKTNHLLTVLILLGALLFVGCSARDTPISVVPEGTQAGELIDLEPCTYKAGKTEYTADCGTLIVPENWDKADSRLIALPVVRIPAKGPNPAEPVFYLNGGPGAPNLVWARPEWLLKDHDVVMVGYRGVEGTVTLSCPDVNRLVKAHIGKDLFSEQARAKYAVAVKGCAVTLQEAGVDLSGYTIPGVVEDMEAARTAFGYEKIHLFSESYGTRIAQIYAYMHPDSLSRLVLIGVNTPGHFIWDRVAFDKMIEHISELCVQDAACSNQTSDFARTMYDVNRDMPAHWLLFNIDPDTVRYGAHVMFFSSQTMPMAFDAYLAAGEGNPSGLAMMNLVMTIMSSDPMYGDMFSKGGSVDLEKYHGIKSISLGDSIMGAPLSEFVWPLATEWPIELIPQDLREFQETDVEMLLVNGTVDFSTPPTALEEAKPYFHKAQIVLLQEFSHTDDVFTIQPKAFERLITSYYDTGVADNSLYVYEPLSFEPGMSVTMMARLLVTAMIVLPALFILGVALVVRRIRQRQIAK